MTIPVEQLQNLNGYTIIELFQIDLVSGVHYRATDTSATTLYRFHNGTNEIKTDIVWDGNSYTPVACQAEGFETGDNTTMARPTLTFANVVGTFSTILEIINQVTVFNDLQTATVTRRRTLAQFLDNINFSSGSNTYGTADPTKELEQQQFLINKKIVENNQICSFELVNTIDFEELQLPRLQITKDRFPAVGSFVFQ
tara:strand:- start:3236 stop:3829 length:594 start_codon:yes stop_codon:yes gene_type:complete